MSQIHITDEQQAVSNVSFDRPFHLVSRAPRDLYSIYALEQPLQPGDVLTLTFAVAHTTRRLPRLATSPRSSPTTAPSSTPATSRRSATTSAVRDRRSAPPPRRAARPASKRWRPRGDPVHSRMNLFTPNADWITYHTVVSTSRRSDRDRAGLSAAHVDRARPPLLRIQHGRDAHRWIFSPISRRATRRARRSTAGRTGR